jgi:site-specific DNA-cytosine methylase
MRAFYNEIEPYAAQWLRNLIAAGLLPDGVVDERDVRDLRVSDLEGYDQVRLFAGIGGWPLALRMAGWRDDERVWTGSCPCQPFSAAGKQGGATDERHLWPAFLGLIEVGKPSIVFGEQVASKLGRAWLSRVRADLEMVGYAVGAADLCAASVQAPHIRQRVFWVADCNFAGRGGKSNLWLRDAAVYDSHRCGENDGVADAGRERVRAEGRGANARTTRGMQSEEEEREWIRADTGANDRGLADANGGQSGDGRLQRSGRYLQFTPHEDAGGLGDASSQQKRRTGLA